MRLGSCTPAGELASVVFVERMLKSLPPVPASLPSPSRSLRATCRIPVRKGAVTNYRVGVTGERLLGVC